MRHLIAYPLAGVLYGGAIAVAAADTSGVEFSEVAAGIGVEFVHDSGKRGKLWTLEITGAGAGVLDFDGDGRMDLWLVQGGPITDDGSDRPTDRLFRNVSRDGGLRFEDVTEKIGLSAKGYGMGIAAADVDNDGDTDVYLTNYGPNQLLLNEGGRFVDATAQAGVAGDEWSIAASFADYDGDGLLDLYVGNYLEFEIEGYAACRRWSSRPTYCAPSNFAPTQDRLYRNLGAGRFEDVTIAAGIANASTGGAMGVVADDLNGDGLTDFYVANDGVDNLMWLNKGGRFENAALLAGTAVNGDGVAEASMGIAIADYDQDDDPDLFVTHDVKESNTLYKNENGAFFVDASRRAGVVVPSLPYSAFGTGWIDVENDGDLDLVLANGAVAVIEEQAAAGVEPPLKQPNLLMLNDGNGGYKPLKVFSEVEASRGAAFGDLDNDGDVDFVVTNNHGPVHVYRNDSASGSFLGLELVGPETAPHAMGAVVRLDGRKERKRVRTDGSYASSHDSRLLFGLGPDRRARSILVDWPDGRVERFAGLSANRYHKIVYGTGTRE